MFHLKVNYTINQDAITMFWNLKKKREERSVIEIGAAALELHVCVC